MVEDVHVAVDLDDELVIHDNVHAEKIDEVLSTNIASIQDTQRIRQLSLTSSGLI